MKQMNKHRVATMVIAVMLLCFNLIGMSAQIAQAQTFTVTVPAFNLYCNDDGIIKSGSVSYDLTDADLFLMGKALMNGEYHTSADGNEVEFAIPFISSAINMPSISVTADGKEVEGEFCYGNRYFIYYEESDIEEAINDTFSSRLDEHAYGTLYKVESTGNDMSVTISLAQGQRLVYDSHNLRSAQSGGGTHTFNFQNPSQQFTYRFFVIGDGEEEFFSTEEYEIENISCQALADECYEEMAEYYEYIGGLSVAFFYSQFNEIISKGYLSTFDSIFFDSLTSDRLNTYKIKTTVGNDTVIRFSTQVEVQGNARFSPMVYMVTQVKTGSYPVKCNVKLGPEYPYILESTVPMSENGTEFSASCEDGDFYFVFSSVKKPTDLYPDTKNGSIDKTKTIILAVCGSVGGIALIVLVFMVVKVVREKRRN